MYWSCVFGDSLHIRMSSIMRWRNGEMARDDASMALLLLRSEAACLVPRHKQFHDPAQPHGRNEARLLPRERFSVRPRGRATCRVQVPVGVGHTSVAEGNCVVVRRGGE